MKKESVESVRRRVTELIDSEFASDAAFERAAALPVKTVDNWRRGRSSSFMRMLPALAELFRVGVDDLLNLPRPEALTLTEEERRLVELYRTAASLPEGARHDLLSAIEGTVRLYLSAAEKIR